MRRTVTRVLVAAFLAASSVAHADDPWAKGVPEATQDRANKLFAEGNELFGRQAHAPALAKYEAAIAVWDHPMIRFNMAVTQIRIDRLLDAADNLDRALRYDNRPFTPELYQRALDYQKLLAGRVGHVEVSCDQPGTRIALDGKPWFVCPGRESRRVLAGEHAVIGEATGRVTQSTTLLVKGGATARTSVRLVPLTSGSRLEYPTAPWKPWTVASLGLGVTVGGIALWYSGRRGMDEFYDEYARVCPQGCSKSLDATPAERDLSDQWESARLRRGFGIATVGVGAAVAATGIVWTIMNRPREPRTTVNVTPTSGGATALACWEF